MGVDNIGFMLERLGQDCDDLQFLRELTKNAVEAGATEIVWDVDWTLWEASDGALYKLCCIDDGCGMTGPEMLRYINQLSSSIHGQAHDGNYGVGAKIAAATRNPAGLIYQSWKEGQGAMIQLWRDPDSGDYGVRQWELPDGTFDYHQPITDEGKPSQIADHGTKVVLLGRSDGHNTVEPPEGAETPSRWVNRYLNARYFRFPEQIEIKAREGWKADPEAKSNLLRGVRGQDSYLEANSDTRGVAELSECRVHWSILSEREARQDAPELVTTGHFAALFHDELYEMRTGRAGMSVLQQFGVIFGHDRVVLYIEPRNGSSARISSNTARTQLLRDGQPLPYADWAAEFRADMPQEIRDHIDAVISGTGSSSHRDSIKERLRNYEKLYRLSRYRPHPRGNYAIEDPRSGRARDRRRGENGSHRSGDGRRQTDRAGSLLATMLADEGRPAERAPKDMEIPQTLWISREQGTRAEGEMEDRAAKFLREDNLIKINGDFRGFTDMIDYWCDDRGVERGNQVIADVVHDWFEQALVETVIGCQSLQGSQRWDPDELDKALSEEALTAAVMQRYHAANAIKRAVYTRMGRPDREAADTAPVEVAG
jgi:hypothetical protein